MRCAAALGIIPGETYREPQASSGKLDKQLDLCYRIIKEKVMSEQSEELKRIANALEEILRMVKKDQEDAKARRKQHEED
jgi:hypothetical protein